MSSAPQYGFSWWAEGIRARLVRCVQTTAYGLALDVPTMTLPHFGLLSADPIPYDLAVEQGNATVFALPAATLELTVELDGRPYRCQAGATGRVILCGRFLQRFDVQGLQFQAEDRSLAAAGRLEVIAWPDRLVLLLEVTPQDSVPVSGVTLGMRLTSPTQPEAWTAQQAWPNWDGGNALQLPMVIFDLNPLLPPPGISTTAPAPAVTLTVGVDALATCLPTPYDAVAGAYAVAVPPRRVAAPGCADLQVLQVRLQSASSAPQQVRIDFAGAGESAITGITAVWRDPDHNPVGLPVQLSKNWHIKADARVLYDGNWFHVLSILEIPAWSVLELELCVVRHCWGTLPMASHAQLCLIGWGGNQQWDEAAVGSWGETITYDPDIGLQRSFIDDMRPSLVTPMNAKETKWGWTNNVGGGDFLIHCDAGGQRQFLTAVRTAYLSHGPNLTHTVYSGVTADGAIAARMEAYLPRTDGVPAICHRFRYDVLQRTARQRLVFYQLGADRYNGNCFAEMAWGDADGLCEAWDCPAARAAFPVPGQHVWFSLHRVPGSNRWGTGLASRGLIIRSATCQFGGQPQPLYAQSSQTADGGVPSCNVELVPPPEVTDLQPGDFVEVVLELLMIPLSVTDYYGPDLQLQALLEAGANTWKPMLSFARDGALNVEVKGGTLVRRHPLQLRVGRAAAASVELTITGGLGHTPVTFLGLLSPLGFTLTEKTEEGWQAVDQAVLGKDFYEVQQLFDGSFSVTYNVLLDAARGAQRFRLSID
eukprot:EG_transcript_3503